MGACCSLALMSCSSEDILDQATSEARLLKSDSFRLDPVTLSPIGYGCILEGPPFCSESVSKSTLAGQFYIFLDLHDRLFTAVIQEFLKPVVLTYIGVIHLYLHRACSL